MVTMAAEEEDEPMSDNELPENVHNRLLGAVSDLYKQKRVKAPVRKESSLHVSEFHLTGVRPEDKKSEKIKISELARVLEKRAGHTKINEQIKSARKKTRKLPKPLEKQHAERLERSVGYANLKRDFNKWDSIVYHQRVAEQVSFPLKKPKVVEHKNPNDFLTTFKTPTELELQLAESMNSSELLKKDKEEEELENFKLSLEEIKERRSIMARLRAQLSYKEAKLARQNRIKSKTFHRIQRKDKIKMQIKEFEELQKTDPEAALKKLELLEKARAQERASLRHRTTGQWARNLSVRAKYDKEARIALSEQLAKSRELTQKLKAGSSSEDEKISEDDEDKEMLNNGSNSWLNKQPSNEVQEFYDKYKKYEEEKEREIIKKKNSEFLDDVSTIEPPKNSNGCKTGFNKRNLKHNNFTMESIIKKDSNVTVNSIEFVTHKVNSNGSSNDVLISPKSKMCKKSINKEKVDDDINGSIVDIEFSVLKRTPVKVISSDSKTSDKEMNSKSKPTKIKLPLKSGPWCVTAVKQGNNFKNNSLSKSKTKTKLQKAEINFNDNKGKIRQMQPDLDDLFFEVEEKLNDSVKKKVKKLKNSIARESSDNHNHFVDLSDGDDIAKDNSYLEIKKQRIQAEMDEELDETHSSNPNDATENSIKKLIEKSSFPKSLESVKKSANIEPNNFFYAKPKKLNSEVPSNFSGAEENLDDSYNEEKTDEKSMTISEAFACDDVDEEFKNEKEDEIKQSQVEEVNLVLPGWGSWGGPNVQVPKHKKRRFIVKFPQQMPRRDENKGNVVINEDKDDKIKPHLVTELPFPFTSVKEYEASIRAPIGRTWLPQSAHRKLIAPAVTTKLGTVIEPMTKDQVLKNKDEWK